jgi:predicted aspartyl protease
MRRNLEAAGRGAPLPNQQQAYNKAQQGQRAGAGRGRGQAYNLTAKEGEASGDVMAGNILVHSISVLALFDSGASHCFISSNFVKLHSLPQHTLEYAWEISTGNGTIVTNKICKSCLVEISGRTLEADMFVLDTGGYDIILGMA